ncbi:MAG: superoxide dismutase [Bacteroidales bacterium]|nr:superoxide dismutase [Bacteroidales bacterium]HOY38441.1 superoxide dismutase [Bacteroidales bacterium]HQP03132.1 superoxide dismutase [Bacteroidales bacterium]
MKRINLISIFILVAVTVVAQHVQQPLPYAYNALEPWIDAQTMEIHYSKHHKAYIDNLNKAVQGTSYSGYDLTKLQFNITGETPAVIRNNGGGHWNHEFFWNILTTPNEDKIPEDLLGALISSFGSFDNFKAEFKKNAMGRFGSGWAWLIVKNGKLLITTTPNQDNPLMPVAEIQGVPILGIDVWEHAYYLKYQNKRGDYVDAFFNVVNWNKVAELYKQNYKK